MSCFFCNSFNHLSQNCDICVSDESRQIIAATKYFCKLCFTDLSNNNSHNSIICRRSQKCYICFSKRHHTFLCHGKNLLVSNIFLPKINEDLFSRFIKLIKPEELILLLLSSSKAATLVKSKQLSVIKENNNISLCNIMNYTDTHLLITDSFTINAEYEVSTNISLPSKRSLIFKGKNINFEKTKICSKIFLQLLLSPRLKRLNCSKVQNAPNLEVIDLNGINIDVNNTWPEEILKLKNGNNLKKLTITLQDIEFNVNSLIKLMKVKSKSGVIITLKIYPNDPSDSNMHRNLENRLLPYFDLVYRFSNVHRNLIIFAKNFYHRYYALKSES